MFEDANNFDDIFRGGLPYYLIFTFFMILCSAPNPATAREFAVQRMTQYDVHGVPYGCRASALNLEAKSVYSWSTSRHCIVSRFQDMTIDQFREIRAKAGGLVMLLPEDVSTLSLEDQQHIYLLEQAMMVQEISIPVYFSRYTAEMETIVNDLAVRNAQKGKQPQQSALAEIFNTVSANGYQIVISGASHAVNKQSKVPIIQGELYPRGKATEDITKLPQIIVTAQLNTVGLMNEAVHNEDVAILLTLVELFSKLQHAPKYRLLFLITEGNSLLNFPGTKKWLEANLEENGQLQNAEFVVCLDGIGRQNTETESLFMHVSKPPKEGTHTNNYFKTAKRIAQRFGNNTVEGVHKRINLADSILAWEHERFSMKRMSAFTLSNIKSHKDPIRSSIFYEPFEPADVLVRNTKIVAESLAQYMYGLKEDSDGEIFAGTMAITAATIRPWTQIRSQSLNNDIKSSFEKYLKNVKVSFDKPEAREPDYMLYDGQDATLNVYHVKPAIFDLFLTVLIAIYLTATYFGILYFPQFYALVCKMTTPTSHQISSPASSVHHQNGKDKVKTF